MIELNEQELDCIEENEELLKYDKFQKFYDVISNDIGNEFGTIGNLTDFFMKDCDINLWDYLDEIPDYMFEASIQPYVVIPNKYNYIPNGMFVGSKIQEIIIPSKIKSIAFMAFYKCQDLTKVTLNEGLEEIGDYAFQNCPNLKEIYLPESVTKVYSGVFYSSGIQKITTPKRNETNQLKYPNSERSFYEKLLEYI